MAVASLAGSALISGLLAAGKTIFWAASWLCTSVLTTECPHSSSPPPIAMTTASTRPAIVATASNVFLRIVGASLQPPGPRSGTNPLLNNQQLRSSPTSGGRAARPQPAGPPAPAHRAFRLGVGHDTAPRAVGPWPAPTNAPDPSARRAITLA